MSSGIILPLASIAYSASNALRLSQGQTDASAGKITSTGSWTPPQYSKPALTILTVPATGNPVLVSAPVSNANGIVSAPVYQGGTPAVDYVFDAVLRLAHKRTIKKTQHPVLTGANISDHFYILPSRVVLEIAMSDAQSSFQADMWVGAATKSVSAWQILKGFQASGQLFTLSTRLDTYYNMQIEDMSSPDDNRTITGLRATIVLEELLSASVSSLSAQSGASTRSQTTGSTSNGTIQSTAPNSSQQLQNVMPSTLWPDAPTYGNVPGAGDVSGTNLGQVPPKES